MATQLREHVRVKYSMVRYGTVVHQDVLRLSGSGVDSEYYSTYGNTLRIIKLEAENQY